MRTTKSLRRLDLILRHWTLESKLPKKGVWGRRPLRGRKALPLTGLLLRRSTLYHEETASRLARRLSMRLE